MNAEEAAADFPHLTAEDIAWCRQVAANAKTRPMTADVGDLVADLLPPVPVQQGTV